MNHRSQGATTLLGMPEFVVGAQMEHDGELWLAVETTETTTGCPDCGTRAVGHGRRQVKVRDLPVAGRPVVLVWNKRIWRCADPDCGVKTFSEETDDIAPRASLTERARAEICRRVGQDADSVAAVAKDFGVGWHAAWAAVVGLGRPRVDHLSRLGAPGALGLDETAFLKAQAKHPTIYVTGFVDLDTHRLIDVVEKRSAKAVSDWLGAKPKPWLEGIRTVTLDPHRGYAKGIATGPPAARLVVDHFHAIRLANLATDRVRRRVQQDHLGHRGRRDDPLYRIRRHLLVARERLTDKGTAKITAGLRAGDPNDEVAAAYLAKELLRDVYISRSLTAARVALVAFYTHCADAEIPELTTLARTISAWEAEILGWHATGLSNGPTEAVNLLIKKVKRTGHGFRNFQNYRLRLLLHCGVKWQTAPTARIRGRQPSLVA